MGMYFRKKEVVSMKGVGVSGRRLGIDNDLGVKHTNESILLAICWAQPTILHQISIDHCIGELNIDRIVHVSIPKYTWLA